MPTKPKPEPSPFSLVSHVFDRLPNSPRENRRKRTLAVYWKLASAQVDRLEKKVLGDSPGLVERVAFHVERGFLCAAWLAWQAAQDPYRSAVDGDPALVEMLDMSGEMAVRPPREYLFLWMLLRAHLERLGEMRQVYGRVREMTIGLTQTKSEAFGGMKGDSAFETVVRFIEKVYCGVECDPMAYAVSPEVEPSLQVDPLPDPSLLQWKKAIEEWARRNVFPAGGGDCRDVEQDAESLIRKLHRECREVRAGVEKGETKADETGAGDAEPEPPPTGEWSLPMTKTEMRVRLGNMTREKFETYARKHGLTKNGRQSFQICLDKMDDSAREKLKSLGKPDKSERK